MTGEDESHVDSDPVYTAEFDFSELPPSGAVVRAVATAADRDPAAIDPLYNHVDPDAIEALVESTAATDALELTFQFDAHRVTIHGDGRVVVQK